MQEVRSYIQEKLSSIQEVCYIKECAVLRSAQWYSKSAQ